MSTSNYNEIKRVTMPSDTTTSKIKKGGLVEMNEKGPQPEVKAPTKINKGKGLNV